MSALQEYLAAVRRQYDFLERVRGLDDQMAEIEPPPPPYYRGRRHWTKQDRNRVQYALDIEAINESPLSDDEKWNAQWGVDPPRQRKRISYAVRMCRRWLDAAKAEALAEAGEMGGFDTLAPLIVEMYRAHDHLCANYNGELGDETDWNEAQWRHADAVEKLAEFVPTIASAPEIPPVSTELSVPKRPLASPPELFPLGPPENKELAECILMLVAQRDGNKADYDILLPRFAGDGALVEAMQAEIRRTRDEREHNLPVNPKRRARTS